MDAYKERFIKDLEKGKAAKVAVVGVIINKDKDSIVLDDKTGIVSVNIENNLNTGDYVRVFGMYLDDFLKGDLIQELNEGNKELHKRVKELLY